MAKVPVEVEVSKEVFEMGEAIAGMVAGTKLALDDGWQMGQDLPAVMNAIISNLAEAIEGVRNAKAEWDEDPQAFVTAISLSIANVVDTLKD